MRYKKKYHYQLADAVGISQTEVLKNGSFCYMRRLFPQDILNQNSYAGFLSLYLLSESGVVNSTEN